MTLCYVLMSVEAGSEAKVLEELRKIPNVKECHRVYGIYDLIAKIEADSMDGLRGIVTGKIRQLQGVRSTFTTVAVD
jgi:DNA-binding Lrp family transcriptional regulator